MSGEFQHEPVMIDETINALVTDRHGDYLDMTFGRGGHTREILRRISSKARLLTVDRDPEAVAVAEDLANEDDRVSCAHGRFSEIKEIAELRGFGEFSGILMDLGVSSPQLLDPVRGFSFSRNGPLDMRMDPTTGTSAEEWLNSADERTLAQVFRRYGEERNARSIARTIVNRRPLKATEELVAAIESCNRQPDPRKHAATRVFQAIRIYVNDELAELEIGLDASFGLLIAQGRLAVLSFHSLEHRIVKRKFRQWVSTHVPPRLPYRGSPEGRATFVVKGGHPEESEVSRNNRSRSALLQVIERAH